MNHVASKLTKTTDFNIKSQTFKSSKMGKKIDINHLENLNWISEKPFLMVLGPIWSKIVFWKNKKLPNFLKNTENPRFFEFPKSQNGRKLPILATLPQSLPKIFFESQNPPKLMKIFPKNLPPTKKRLFFLGGGGGRGINLLNIVFVSFDKAWPWFIF